MIVALVTVLHVLVGVLLIIVVLLQAGKGADIGAAFGGASQTFFGGRGAATFLAKATAGAAAVFMITSLYLAHVSGRPSTNSLLDSMPPTPAASPAAPAASPAEPAPAAPAQPGN
ncbi:MAG TPA: preprotein translocase subunit SecG [Thermodesulfobacteriota bacterium]